MARQRRIVDLSHPISSGMAMHPGLPSARIEPHLTHTASRPLYGGAAEFTITRFFMLGNSGTYLDSPWHRHRGGRDLSDLSLGSLADLEGVCLDPVGPGSRDLQLTFRPAKLRGRAVLVRTGWSARWGSPGYWQSGPFLGAATVERLVDAEPALVGVDFWNADDPSDPTRPAHSMLLGADIPIVEQLRGLDVLPIDGFRFFAVPPAVEGGASFPVRAFAVIQGLEP